MAKNNNIIKIVAISVVLMFLISGFSAIFFSASNGKEIETFKNQSLLSQIKVNLPINNSKMIKPFNGKITVMITFRLRNENILQSYLAQLDNPKSNMYHKYMNRSEFTKLFGPTSAFYNNVSKYFSQFKSLNIETFQDHISIVLSGSASTLSEIFNAKFAIFYKNGRIFYSITQDPSLPVWISNNVSYISGLNNYTKPSIDLHSKLIKNFKSIEIKNDEYPSPISNGNTQEIFGSDLQVAYDEQTLFNFTYPFNEVVATILWSGQYIGPNITTPYGTLTNGTLLGPFDPSDIYAYYNDTLPSWEPHSKVIPVPLDGAPEPSPLASYDTSGAVGENTLDLEMVGSTAPGSTIFNVYGPNSTIENLDYSLAFILNPNSSYSKLNNVTVISNSWGSLEYNDTAWYEYLQEAQARGITVLASSGDSGDNPNSSKYSGSYYPNDWVEFPSAMAYNYFGVTAVGGTTLTLNSMLHIENQVAWYISQNDTANGGPAGSTGGISQVFPEPYWQLDSLANNVIHGA